MYCQRCRIDLCYRQPWCKYVQHWSHYTIRKPSSHTHTWIRTSPAFATTYSVTRKISRVILLNQNTVVSPEPQQTPRRSSPLDNTATPNTSITMGISIHHQPNPSDARRLRNNYRERTSYAHSNDAINERRCIAHGMNKDAVNARRRDNRKATQQSCRYSVLAARSNLFDYEVFRGLEDDTSHLQEVMAQRKQALDATRDEMGVTIKNADPCTQCGAKLFGK